MKVWEKKAIAMGGMMLCVKFIGQWIDIDHLPVRPYALTFGLIVGILSTLIVMSPKA